MTTPTTNCQTIPLYNTCQELLGMVSNPTFSAPRLFWLLLLIDIEADIGFKATGRLAHLQRAEARRFIDTLPPHPARTRLCQIFAIDPSSLSIET